jgi:NAD(P)-dependent dehydrogenase (short-subunit alcohol dehydrogenase family)
MDLGLTDRTVYLSGSDRVLAACAGVLVEEGAEIVDDPGAADIVVAAGARRPDRDLLELDEADLFAAWGDMIDRGWGRLVWIGSAQARSVDASSDECGAVTTLGMLGLHKVLSAETGAAGVTANAVLRGGPATDVDAAAAVAFLCSVGAAYLTGVSVTVDGGVGSAVF